ncbi:hypothetical protein [Candidatus Nitronereus thalassa]|uniref:Uncharacterized protein n=1 Tax=Candidatus Nitronereus thalassa TaxID=3020898 RepID=A0ABU3K8H4_9BACT|nr:hypothetical protein [Candidatus Nitronereus thalassa]MDT7042681.1 hypothetical protein [Candidatus Nitronereus thalassa]
MKPKCGAKSKSTQQPCKNLAGFRTDHFGVGRCFMHGGKTPIKSGIYSTVVQNQWHNIYQDMLDQKETLASINDEIAFLRVCAMQTASGAEALLDSDQRKKACELGLELGILDSYTDRIRVLTEILERITRAVKRKVEIEQGIAIRLTPAQLTQFIEAFKTVVTRHVTNMKVVTAIGRDLSTLF